MLFLHSFVVLHLWSSRSVRIDDEDDDVSYFVEHVVDPDRYAFTAAEPVLDATDIAAAPSVSVSAAAVPPSAPQQKHPRPVSFDEDEDLENEPLMDIDRSVLESGAANTDVGPAVVTDVAAASASVSAGTAAADAPQPAPPPVLDSGVANAAVDLIVAATNAAPAAFESAASVVAVAPAPAAAPGSVPQNNTSLSVRFDEVDVIGEGPVADIDPSTRESGTADIAGELLLAATDAIVAASVPVPAESVVPLEPAPEPKPPAPEPPEPPPVFAGAFDAASESFELDFNTAPVNTGDNTKKPKVKKVVSDGVIVHYDHVKTKKTKTDKNVRPKTGKCFKNNRVEECFEPSGDACQSRAQRKAIVHAYDFSSPLNLNAFDRSHTASLRQHLEDIAEIAKNHSADHILMVPQGRKRLYENESMADELQQLGLKFLEVPWVVPPGLSPSVPINSGGCCGAGEFIKLHAFNLTQYDAIVFYDTDISFNKFREWPEGVLSPLFDCAASNYFMSTSAMPFHGVNSGFFAVKPNHDLFQAALDHLHNSQLDKDSGWNGHGWGPGHSVKQWRMQGFLASFMYQSGYHEPYVNAKQLDPCIWSRQEHTDCSGNSSLGLCKEVTRILHHSRCL